MSSVHLQKDVESIWMVSAKFPAISIPSHIPTCEVLVIATGRETDEALDRCFFEAFKFDALNNKLGSITVLRIL